MLGFLKPRQAGAYCFCRGTLNMPSTYRSRLHRRLKGRPILYHGYKPGIYSVSLREPQVPSRSTRNVLCDYQPDADRPGHWICCRCGTKSKRPRSKAPIGVCEPPRFCISLGLENGTTLILTRCHDKTPVPTFACTLHGECTLDRLSCSDKGLACCDACDDYATEPAEPTRTST